MQQLTDVSFVLVSAIPTPLSVFPTMTYCRSAVLLVCFPRRLRDVLLLFSHPARFREAAHRYLHIVGHRYLHDGVGSNHNPSKGSRAVCGLDGCERTPGVS